MNEFLTELIQLKWYWQLLFGLAVFSTIDWFLERLLSFRLTIVHKHIIEVKGCESTSK